MRHLDNLVLKNGLLAGFLCATLIFGLGWTGWVHLPVRQARLRAEKNVEYAAAMLDVEFDRVERTAKGFRALWWQNPNDMNDPTRLRGIQPFLDHGGLIKNIILSKTGKETILIARNRTDWDMILVRPTLGPTYIHRNLRGTWWNVEIGQHQPENQPNQRPWFQAAEGASGPTWTPPYAFIPANAGYTFVVPVRKDAQLVGVVGVDVAVDNLERMVRRLLPPSEFQVLVTDPADHVLVPPDTAPQDAKAREALLLAPASREILAAFQQQGPFRYQRRVRLRSQGPLMDLRVSVSPEALVPGLGLRIAVVTLAAGLAFAAVMAYVFFLNLNLVRPIRRLLGQESPVPAPSEIWEFHQLEDSILRLGQTEKDRQQILQQLEHAQRVETMGTMAPGVIHDLNNHLSVILAQLGLCQEEVDGMPRFHARIGKAERATLRCAQAMQGLLAYSRPGPSQPRDFDLNELVRNTVSLLEPVLGETIRVETNLEEALPTLQGEPVKLQQVLVNLALNGRDAMRGVGFMAFRTRRVDQMACLEVQDTGCGMSEEVKAKLFDPFFTTKEPGKGTGLGLTMVQRIVSAHGGTILVDSEPGNGTRFLIHLPIGAPCPDEACPS